MVPRWPAIASASRSTCCRARSPRRSVFPADAAVGVATAPDPRDRVRCRRHRGALRDRAGFRVHERRPRQRRDSSYTCSYVALTGLQGDAVHYWSARVRDAEGDWSDWSTPSQFTTAHAGVDHEPAAAAGRGWLHWRERRRHPRLRGDPFNPVRIWTRCPGRVADGPASDPEPRELPQPAALRDPWDHRPNSVVNAYLELTGYQHEARPTSTSKRPTRSTRCWCPGARAPDSPAPDPGEVSWPHSEYRRPGTSREWAESAAIAPRNR